MESCSPIARVLLFHPDQKAGQSSEALSIFRMAASMSGQQNNPKFMASASCLVHERPLNMFDFSAGDLMLINVLGKSLLFVNKHADVIELLEKRSANFSSRPRSIFLREL